MALGDPNDMEQVRDWITYGLRLIRKTTRLDLLLVILVRSLIEDIRDVRFHKVETGLETISGRTHAVKLKNLSAMEVNIVRPFMVRTLQAFNKHDSPQMIQQADNIGSRATPITYRGPREAGPVARNPGTCNLGVVLNLLY
ncbi:unnamed protein product [Miscanthus lutarioriparius]|uniref:GINS subunit domain-containing protein n=1 Tax=Miscanthus lutarioriparius TaxID=422564 RepID=A0A811M9A9_9POAL|nr:unnamed protein product [Miscanthus lutarioriparius]